MLEQVVRRLLSAFTRYILKRYAHWLIIFTFLLTISLSLGLVNLFELRDNNSIKMYTPLGAQAYYERDVIAEHWPLNEDKFIVGRSFEFERIFFVIIQRRRQCSGKPCNLLENDKYLDTISELEQVLATRITVHDEHNNVYSYDNTDNSSNRTKLCLNYGGTCHRVASTHGSLYLLKNRKLVQSAANVSISYPQTNAARSQPIYLAWNLGGVSPANGSLINEVQCVKLVFFMKTQKETHKAMSTKLENAMAEYIQNEFPSTAAAQHLEAVWYHSRALDLAMQENTAQLVPRFLLTFCVLVCFSLVMLLKWKSSGGNCPRIDMVKSKPILALCGIVTSLCAIVSAVGLLLWLRCPYNDVIAVMPFLIISVGVDDMFIIVAAWHDTDTSLSVNRRMERAIGDAAAAITITSLTSALSFGVGCMTSILAVRLFCAYAAVAICFNYFYQLTLFAPFMLYAARREHHRRGVLSCCNGRTDDTSPATTTRTSTNMSADSNSKPTSDRAVVNKFELGYNDTQIEKKQCKANDEDKENKRCKANDEDKEGLLQRHYVPLLLHWVTKSIVAMLYIGYIAMAIVGCIQIKTGLQYHKIVLKTDPVVKYFERDAEYFPSGLQMEIVFNKVPSLINAAARDRIEHIIQEFETKYQQITGSFLRDDIETWLYGVLDWWQFNAVVWGLDILPHGQKQEIKAFRARIGLARSYTAEEFRDGAVFFRNLSSAYPEYNITTYNIYRELADQSLFVVPNTIQTAAIALACMCVVALLLLPSLTCTLLILLAMLSIDIGVVGYLSLWHVRMDPIIMITLIMSIGFSVDFTAHIMYGYMTSDEEEVRGKIKHSIVRLAWPVTQGALSTTLGVSLLANGDSYILMVFTKTVLLVMGFGTLHALVLLPMLLDTVMPLVAKWKNKCSGNKIKPVSDNS